ncbi:DUF6270 domain-containing protein [Sporolactobacillus sp. Y61]|uniref:DUF6270 domain-containing protein n=1 Tax=Sporolactobacillus sp. Y61 TaxID=3160863 RepID=A0AAU8IC08_9BACL
MNTELLKVKNTRKKKSMILKGKCDSRIVEGFLLFEERIKGNDLFIPRDIKIPCIIKRNVFTAEIDLTDVCSLINSQDIWDIFFVSDQQKTEVSIPELPGSFSNQIISIGFLLITFYKNSRGTLSISVKKNNQVGANLLSVSKEKDAYEFHGELLQADALSYHQAFLAIRRRENKNALNYLNEIEFPLLIHSNKKWSAHFNKQSIFTDPCIRHEEVWDLFLKLTGGKDNSFLYIPLHNEATLNDTYTVIQRNNFYQAKFYMNKKGCIGLWIKRIALFMELKKLSIKNSQLDIFLEVPDDINVLQAKITIANEIWAAHFNGFCMDGMIRNKFNSICISLSLKQLKENYKIEKNDLFQVLVQLEDKKSHAQTWMPLFVKTDQPINARGTLADNLDAIINISQNQKFEIKTVPHMIKEFDSRKPIKLAILGTCYTRGAFNSRSYFNPEYKSKYNIAYTQFHSSIPSLMSKPLPYPASYFAERKPIEKAYIACDFEKTFFNELEKSKADYFLFDLYPDAVRDLVIFDDDHMITGSFYLRNREFLKNLHGKASFVSHNDEPTFLKYWCPAAERFAKAIVKYFPQNHIILQKARMTDRYYDKNHQVRYFADQIDLVKRSNMYYQFMESYLLHLLPHIHTIDLNHYGFIGQYNHPYGRSTNHYEPDYYKELVRQLDHIVLREENLVH